MKKKYSKYREEQDEITKVYEDAQTIFKQMFKWFKPSSTPGNRFIFEDTSNSNAFIISCDNRKYNLKNDNDFKFFTSCLMPGGKNNPLNSKLHDLVHANNNEKKCQIALDMLGVMRSQLKDIKEKVDRLESKYPPNQQKNKNSVNDLDKNSNESLKLS